MKKTKQYFWKRIMGIYNSVLVKKKKTNKNKDNSIIAELTCMSRGLSSAYLSSDMS